VLFLASVQLLCIGILGQYVGRIYDETKQRPPYVLAAAPAGQDGAARPEPGGAGAPLPARR
jgi:hypothetical protein